MIRIERAALVRMHAHAARGFPHEVVGVLAGDRASNTVTRVERLVNERADRTHDRYEVGGLLLMRAEQRLNRAGLEVVGYFHSHPDHPARYSDFDRDHALPNMSYVIVSVLGGGVADTLSWRLRDDRSAMDAEDIEILES